MPTCVKKIKGNLCHRAELATSSANQQEGIYTWAARNIYHSVDKELAGWSHSKSYGQQLNVQVETSDE